MFLLGGEAGAAEQAKECLESSFPGAVICGAYSPPPSDYPFPEEIQSDIRERILEAKPHILFVAFGCPKQDVWIREHTESLGVIISVGIGGSFNFITGRVPRAPRLLQQCGLEWAFRLFREPRRLWRRYLRHDLPFVFKLLFLELVRRLHLTRRPVLEVLT
jgi:N-acetylglucosaminyldiphosphoundecaprenol N-acetyl-beta-D-mannosaminyltransferase